MSDIFLSSKMETTLKTCIGEDPISNGDFSHGPQYVFWTCLDEIVKSKDVSSQKNTGFLDGLK